MLFLSSQMSKYCIENDVYGLATFVTLSRHTCLCDIKACGVTLAGSKLSQSHSTARVTSRGQATVPTQNFKQMGFFSAMNHPWTASARHDCCAKACSPQLLCLGVFRRFILVQVCFKNPVWLNPASELTSEGRELGASTLRTLSQR